MQILHRALQRDDQGLPAVIDLVDDGCQRGGPAAAGRTCHQHQAALLPVQLRHGLRYAHLLRQGNLPLYQAHRQRHGALLLVGIGPAAPSLGQGEGKRVLPFLLEPVTQGLRHDAYQDIQHIRRRKPGTVHGKKLPADPHLGGHPRGQMHIAGPRLPGAAYDFFYRRHRRPTSPFEAAPAA